jgi:NTE family protein
MGVDLVIAVDVSSPLQPGAELDSALAVSNQMVAILINRATERSRATLGPGDLIVVPDLGTMSSVEFGKVRGAVAAGERAARAQQAALTALAVPPVEFARFLARGTPPPAGERIAFVRVPSRSGAYRRFVEAALQPLIGRPADALAIDAAMRRLYGRDLFETLDYSLIHDGGQAGLEVSARRKSWGPTYLRFGLDLQDDFQGTNNFTAGVRFVKTEMNPFMAELNVDLALGERPKFAAEFYQPLGYASPWFVAPRMSFDSRSVQVQDAGRLVGEYRVRETAFALDFGRELSDWGELRAGLQRLTGSTHLRIGTPTAQLPEATSFKQGGWLVRLSVDRLDSVNFPRHGELFVLEWDAQRAALGADRDGNTARMDWLLARSGGQNTLILWTSAGTALSAPQGVQNYFPLGGFLNLSGINAGALSGPHFGIARLVYLRKVGTGGPSIFDVPTYVGMSLEAGNVWQQRGAMSFGSARKDASLFFGLDTLLGPLYIGTGYDQSGSTSYYLFLGRTF